jgi:hypothetical protein
MHFFSISYFFLITCDYIITVLAKVKVFENTYKSTVFNFSIVQYYYYDIVYQTGANYDSPE